VLDIEREVLQAPRFAHVSREDVRGALQTAKRLAVDKLLPHNRRNDVEEPHWTPGEGVTMHPEVGPALEALAESGLLSAHADFELGGMQLPSAVSNALSLPLFSANVGTMTVPFLTVAAGNMLAARGSKEQVDKYLRPMLEGRFTGTMNLSEPQAGSSLGDITTKAFRNADGTYSLRGTKMWISGGELPDRLGPYDNIVHMVLAKVCDPAAPDQVPAGVKGISLFIAPKFRLKPDGTRGEHNGIELAGLNHKMGWRGVTNTVLNYGESNDTIGELLGAEGEGLATMFLMMNEARITIGLIAGALGYAGYGASLEYARERTQGRPQSGSRDPNAPQCPIIEHTDVRRMLLAQKAYVEGSLALCLYGSTLVDQAEEDSEKALLLDVLTPIIKSWPSEWALEANKWAIQIFGGYGYTRDYPAEQFYRDNRLNMIHEGTNGIQSLDLLGRKVGMQGGRGLQVLVEAMRQAVEEVTEAAPKLEAEHASQLSEHAGQLAAAVDELERTTSTLLGASDRELMLCNSHEYLNMAGHVVIAWQWIRMELAAARGIAQAGSQDKAFFAGKMAASRYFFRHELPKTKHQAALLGSLDDTVLRVPPDAF